MDLKRLKKLQGMNRAVDRLNSEVSQETLRTVKEKLASRGYRADLMLATAAKDTTGAFSAEVKFNKDLGYPSEKDIMTMVAQSYPDHDIDWGVLEVDPSGTVRIQLQPSVEVIPVASIKKIPSEFVSIGAGIFKRASDSSGKAMEIWTLKKTDDGLALLRSPTDVEITADENKDGFKAGDVVNTPYGPGRLLRFDNDNNALVQVGSKKHLVAASDLREYSLDKERSRLVDYLAEAYGDRAYAEDAAKSYGDKAKK